MNEQVVVMVGFGTTILPGLDAVLPRGALTIVEDPRIVKIRDVRQRITAFGAVGRLVESPVQDLAGLPGVVRDWDLPSGVTAVVPGLEYGVPGAAALAEHLGRPGATFAASRRLRDKAALREAAGRAGIAQPRWRRVVSATEVSEFDAADCVLKPTSMQASIGVQVLGAGADRRAAWDRARRADDPLMRAPDAPPTGFLVEERLRGPEVSVEALFRLGSVLFANVTSKTVVGGRHPVELGHAVPGLVTEAERDRLTGATARLAAAVGFSDGILHAEWILVDGEPFLVECAGRMPGDDIVPLIDRAYGGSLVADLLTVLSGREPARPGRAVAGAAVRFLTAEPGLVTGVSETAATVRPPGTVDVRVTTAPGARVGALESSWDRVGRVLATAPDTGSAVDSAVRAAARITIRTVPGEVRSEPDPRAVPGRWPDRPGDPRADRRWAVGAGTGVRFTGPAGHPALWLRGPHGLTGRTDPIEVISGAVAGRDPAPGADTMRTVHPRFVVATATGYGSPVTPTVPASSESREALAATLIEQAATHGAVPAVLHCPAADPLLPALRAAGFAVGATDLYPVLELPGEGLADYLAALPRSHRDNVRGEIRRRARGPAQVLTGEAARPYLPEAARLSACAYRQRGAPGDDARAVPIYTRLLDAWGDDFVLMLVGDEAGPVASAVLVAGATDLLLYSVGLELPRSRRVAGYFNSSYYMPIEFAYERGLRRILLGPTGWGTKKFRGAGFSLLCSAVPATAAALAERLAVTDAWVRAEAQRLG